MIDNLAMMWSRGGHEDDKLTWQQIAEKGVIYFTKKYGYAPTRIEYSSIDGDINIEKYQVCSFE